MFKPWGECAIQRDTAGDIISEAATFNCIPVIFANLLSALLAFAGLVALVMFILGGFKYLTSAGDAKKLEGAKNNFVFGIIGLAIVAFSFLLINIISTITGVKCITDVANFGFNCK